MSIAIASATVGTVAGCQKPAAQAPGGGMMAPAVTVAQAMVQQEPIYLEEIGKAVASESVTIQPQVTGKITDRKFEDGHEVVKNQILFQIDDRPYKATLDQAKGQLKKDTAMYENAKSVVEKDQKAEAENKGALAETQVEADKATMDEAAASMEADRASIDAAQINFDFCTIKSPLNGLAGVRQQDVGNVVIAAGQGTGTSLLTIQDMTPIYVEFTITEAELTRVRQYMTHGELVVEASLPQDVQQSTSASMPTTMATAAPGTDKPVEPKNAVSGPMAGPTTMATTGPTTMATTMPGFEPRRGTLTFLDNSVQDGTGTVKLRGTFENKDKHFWPGSFVNVKLILEIQKDAVLVPRQSTQISQVGPFVYTVDASSHAHVTNVVLGQRYGDLVMIESGLHPGDKVIVTGQQLVQPEGPVTVVPAGPPGGQGGH